MYCLGSGSQNSKSSLTGSKSRYHRVGSFGLIHAFSAFQRHSLAHSPLSSSKSITAPTVYVVTAPLLSVTLPYHYIGPTQVVHKTLPISGL
jgi:hypothetical protein